MKSIHSLALLGALSALTVFSSTASFAAPTIIEMTVENRGKVDIQLFTKEAPKTCAQIIKLAKSKFYDGILVHRVVPNFVVQAGNKNTKTHGVDAPETKDLTPIPFETNSLTHETGTLGIALTAPRSNTGDSQWFINLKPNHNLDGDYCVFGKVVKGMDVVNKMQRGDKIVSFKVIKRESDKKNNQSKQESGKKKKK